jgi:hypothetical protein
MAVAVAGLSILRLVAWAAVAVRLVVLGLMGQRTLAVVVVAQFPRPQVPLALVVPVS